MVIKEFQGEYRFLSNFWSCKIIIQDIVYPSAEHCYVAAKTTDITERKRIAALVSPAQAKRFGRTLMLRPDWMDIRLKAMEYIVRRKFQNPTMKALLLNTGDALLEEGNCWKDTFWGVCNGQGENNLGKILMKVRREFNSI